MDKFPVMSMRNGDDVTVTTRDGVEQGLVEAWTNHAGEGFAVQVKLFGGGYQWFYVREGAKFWR
jgi:hypothetical protein